MRLTRCIGTALFPVLAALASFAAPNAAKAYDMDCKLILCMAGGFPASCGDAHDHMMDRLRDGKSPIGTCSMAGGGEYKAYDLDYSIAGRGDSEAWICPEGKNKYFGHGYNNAGSEVTKVFCYDERRRLSYGDKTYIYTGMTMPEYKDFTVRLTVEPGTDAEYSSGVQRFSTGRSHGTGTRVIFRP